MNDRKAQFRTFSDDRLIQVIKNARQFGYSDEIRTAALEVLEERDISEEDLHLTGNLANSRYDYALTLYNSYTINSGIAFVLYGVLLFVKALFLFGFVVMDQAGLIYLLFFLTGLTMYLVFLFRSLSSQINFYKAIGKELGVGDQLIFVLIGIPLYLFMFFFYRKQMAEEMQMVQ